jgi:hypothetical protein
MPNWINSRASPPAEPQPKPDASRPNAPPEAAVPVSQPDEGVTLSSDQVIRQLLSELRRVQAALTSGGELVKVEFDLLQEELAKPKPAPGILHKAVDIIRHKVTERGETTFSNAGRAQLAGIDELIALLPNKNSSGK